MNEFTWKDKSRGVRVAYCRPCRAAYGQEHYQKNKSTYIANSKERNQKEMARRQQFLIGYFDEHPCVDCGENDPVVLEFDHLAQKEFNISEGMRNRPWQTVLDEMKKCEVVCANCHRRRTFRRGGFVRQRLTRNANENWSG